MINVIVILSERSITNIYNLNIGVATLTKEKNGRHASCDGHLGPSLTDQQFQHQQAYTMNSSNTLKVMPTSGNSIVA